MMSTAPRRHTTQGCLRQCCTLWYDSAHIHRLVSSQQTPFGGRGEHALVDQVGKIRPSILGGHSREKLEEGRENENLRCRSGPYYRWYGVGLAPPCPPCPLFLQEALWGVALQSLPHAATHTCNEDFMQLCSILPNKICRRQNPPPRLYERQEKRRGVAFGLR